jgi:stage V sporulation protein AE
MEGRTRLILVTDGDNIARRALETAAAELGLRCISASAGNPTPLTGPELLELIAQVPFDPVLVMCDDKGDPGRGRGELAIAFLCSAPSVEVLGVVAVASHTKLARGTPVDVSVTRLGRLIHGPVDKEGDPRHREEFLQGDTVDVLRTLDVPIIVGLGDPGKMHGADDHLRGCHVTIRAIQTILHHHGLGPPPVDGVPPLPPPHPRAETPSGLTEHP